LVITARCDAEQDKVLIYNYLPVVRLDDWLHRDGKTILADRLLSESIGQMKSALNDGHYSFSVLETESPHTILEKLFPVGNKKANNVRGWNAGSGWNDGLDNPNNSVDR
jgi:hypothetical protein